MPDGINQWGLTSYNAQGGSMLEKIHIWTVKLLLYRSQRRKIHKSRKNAESGKQRICDSSAIFGFSLWLALLRSCTHVGGALSVLSRQKYWWPEVCWNKLLCLILVGTWMASGTVPMLFTVTCAVFVNQFNHKSVTLIPLLEEEVVCRCCFNEIVYWLEVFW